MPRRPAGLERPTSGANRSDRLPSHGDFIGLRISEAIAGMSGGVLQWMGCSRWTGVVGRQRLCIISKRGSARSGRSCQDDSACFERWNREGRWLLPGRVSLSAGRSTDLDRLDRDVVIPEGATGCVDRVMLAVLGMLRDPARRLNLDSCSLAVHAAKLADVFGFLGLDRIGRNARRRLFGNQPKDLQQSRTGGPVLDDQRSG